MLFGKRKQFNRIVECVTDQQIENAEIIEELLRQKRDLMGSTMSVDAEVYEIVAAQQKAIRNLQETILKLQIQEEEA